MRSVVVVLFCAFSIAVYAQLPPPFAANPNAVTDVFQWDNVRDDLRINPFTSAGSYTSPPTTFSMEYTGQPPSVYTLRTLGPAIVSRITSKQWAIVGHLKYDNVAAGSFLELENWFAPENAGGPELYFYSRTLADAGPLSKIEGSDDGHDFALPFDSTGAKTRLVRLVLKLHLAGPGRLEFSNVRLVQYPDAAPSDAAAPKQGDNIIVQLKQPAGAPLSVSMEGTDYPTFDAFEAAAKDRLKLNPQTGFVLRGGPDVGYASVTAILDALRKSGATNIFFANAEIAGATNTSGGDGRPPSSVNEPLDRRSFILGVLVTVAAIVGSAALYVLGRRFRSLRHARELRRIASLDG